MKALVILMLTILAINVSYAGYGEDQKGECIKGKDFSRGQEVVTQETVVEESKDKEEKKGTNK